MTILDAYEYCDGNKTKAAELLGMSRTSYRRAYSKLIKPADTKLHAGKDRVLVFSCTHAPAMRDDFIPFLQSIYKKHNCTRVVHLGDLVDWHAISFHESDPSLPSPSEEFTAALRQVRELHSAFPVLDYMIGNHDALPDRQARRLGLPSEVMKDFQSLWELDGWTIHPRFARLWIDNVQYRHGDMGKGGMNAAKANAMAEFCSLVQGHLHAQAGVTYHANEQSCVFGLSVGCGVAHSHPAMNYGRVYTAKPIVGCGVVYNDKFAVFEPMELS